jgi:hypothetical protein
MSFYFKAIGNKAALAQALDENPVYGGPNPHWDATKDAIKAQLAVIAGTALVGHTNAIEVEASGHHDDYSFNVMLKIALTRVLMLLALVGALFFPVQTFAQPPALDEIVMVQPGSTIGSATGNLVLAQLEAPAPSAAEKFLDMALTPEGIALILGTLATIAGLIWGGRELAFKRRFALGIYHAYQITNDLVDEGLVKPGGKPHKALQVIDEYMVRHGWRPLKSNEQAIAELGFKSLHGAEKQQVKVLAEAQLAAARGPIVYGGDK